MGKNKENYIKITVTMTRYECACFCFCFVVDIFFSNYFLKNI